jgi:ABC-type multidrug transport system fused ATPase/permease subunit
LISRFFDPDSGTVTLDEIPLPEWHLTELRKRIGFVSQEPLLFTDTVKNNIRFGRDSISDEQIILAAQISQLEAEVKSFSSQYDTQIGLRGMTVSGGQKQRISIARALAGDPAILILDDATAHLDAETEAAFWDLLHESLPATRVFVVSHRTATLERADLIIVLKNGKIAEQGSHQELVASDGEYCRIYSRAKIEEYVRNNEISA